MRLFKNLIVVLVVFNIRVLMWLAESSNIKTIRHGLGKIQKFMHVEGDFDNVSQNRKFILKKITISFKSIK